MTIFIKKFLLAVSICYLFMSSLSFSMNEDEETNYLAHVAPANDVILDFSDEQKDWHSGCADYSIGQEGRIDFKSGIRTIPNLLGAQGYLLEGNNSSDDLFMYVSIKYPDLKPNTNYKIEFKQLVFATNAPAGNRGVGGAPGESVHVKVGASTLQPKPERKNQFFRMNIDHGCQADDGENAVVMGNFAKTSGNSTNNYELKIIDALKKSRIIKTTPSGELWFFVGTDSGFESWTSIYFISANFTIRELKDI